MSGLKYISLAVMFLAAGSLQFFIAQDTGPGGVGTSSNNIIWLDASQLGLSDGDAVATWSDISGNGNDFTQGSASDQPTYNASGSINSMSTVFFNGSSDYLGSAAISALNTDELSYFVVFDNQSSLPTPTDEKFGMVLSTRSSSYNIEWALQLKRENANIVSFERYARKSTGAYAIAPTTRNNAQSLDPNIVNGIWRSSDNIYGLTNGGSSVSVSGANDSGFSHVATHLGAALDGTDASVRHFQGEIAEVIVFSEEINSAQEKLVHNYLSAKYNITIDASVSRYSHNSSHSADVAGIGRDNASNEHLSAQGSGVVSMTIASLDDLDYMVWGHDNAGFAVSTSDVPAAYVSTNGNRIDQEWIVTETGDLSDNPDITLTFDISGNEFGDSDEYQLLINQNGDTDWTDSDTIPGSYAAGVITFTVPAGSLINGSKFTLGNKQKTIISIVDGQDWNQTSTWSCTCVPLEGNDVTVDLGHSVTISDAQAVNDLIVTGALLFDNGADFDIKGDVASTGTFTMNSSSSVTLSGTSAQTLDFTGTVAFDNLELNNSGGAILNTGSFTFSSSLLVTDGDLDFNNNSVTFLSSASGTAAIGPISGTISNLSNVISQRFIEAGNAGWTEVGFPFLADCDLTEWDDYMFMSGPTNFDDGCAYDADGCFNSAMYWDPTANAGSGANVGIDDAAMNIPQGMGIDLYLGDNLNTWSAKTLVVDQRPLNLTLSEEISTLDGWNFIANPFLCPVDFNLATRSGVDNFYWIYDAEDGWLYYDAGGPPFTNSGSVNMFNGVISAYQGFWVYSTGAGSITFDQSTKSVSSSDEFLKSGTYLGTGYLTVTIDKENSINPPSRVYLNLSAEKSPNDYVKLPTRHLDYGIYAVDDSGIQRTLLSVGEVGECKRIPLGIEGISNGDYALSFENIPDKGFIYLIDQLTGEVHELKSGQEYVFNLSEEDEDRFALLLSKTGVNCEESSYQNLSFDVASFDQGFMLMLDKPLASYKVQVIDMLGQLVYQSNLITDMSLDSEHAKNLLNGTYIVSLVDEVGSVLSSEKLVVIR